MATRKSEAEAFRMAYGAGLMKRSEVIAWACQVAQDEDHPDPAICEIATASRVDDSEFHSLLDAVPGTPDAREVRALVLGTLSERRSSGTVSTSEAARALYELAQHDRFAFSEEDRAIMLRLDDALELAASGVYGAVSSVTAEIDAFLSRPPPFDFERAFSGDEPDLRIIGLGELALPTGRICVTDPFVGPGAQVQMAPGEYRVRLAVVSSPEWGTRVAAARLDRGAEPRPPTWSEPVADFGVDAGLASFASAEDWEVFERTLAAHDGNYYDDVLDADLVARQAHDGALRPDWCMHAFGDPKRSIAVCASGLGDGWYDVVLGYNAAGEAVALGVEFGLRAVAAAAR
jgi:hypothetical protein